MIVLRPQGKLDVLGSALFKQQVERVSSFATEDQGVWIVDLAEIESINHFGVTSLMGARRTALEKGAKLLLRNVSDSVHFILEVAQLLDYFEFDYAEVQSPLEQSENSDPGHSSISAANQQVDNKSVLTDVTGINIMGHPIEDASTADAISNLQKIIANMRTKLK
jgi:anti-anti-sigma factor